MKITGVWNTAGLKGGREVQYVHMHYDSPCVYKLADKLCVFPADES